MIRLVTSCDEKAIIQLGNEMHCASRYAWIPFSPERFWKTVMQCGQSELGYAKVFENEKKEVIGGLMGVLQPYYFSDAMSAHDLAVFVQAGMRGGIAANLLLRDFENWADDHQAIEVRLGVTAGIKDDLAGKLYKRLGYQEAGTLFVKRIV